MTENGESNGHFIAVRPVAPGVMLTRSHTIQLADNILRLEYDDRVNTVKVNPH